jgi:hypothetical protein
MKQGSAATPMPSRAAACRPVNELARITIRSSATWAAIHRAEPRCARLSSGASQSALAASTSRAVLLR